MGPFKPVFRPQPLRSAFSLFAPQIIFRPAFSSKRAASSTPTSFGSDAEALASKPPEVPQPTPFVPDVETFLTLIGRGLKGHASKFPTWESLFSLSSEQLKELGIEPPRTRKYLIQWRQKFRYGQFGIGGDIQHVQDGKADLRILEYDKDPLRPKKFVVNVPLERTVKDTSQEELCRVAGYHVEGARTIVGPYALPLKDGQGARVTITEGMWEDKRGRKIDGGERRRTEVRYKKRIQERREMRERGEIP